MKDRYRRVHAFYDVLCTVFSLGAIDRCRAAAVAGVAPGERILIAGCGTAPEARMAADAGADLTLVDLSPAMLRRARRRLGGSPATLVHDDVRRFRDRCRADGVAFDRVVANFFLNVFAEPEAREVLAALRDLVRPGGRLCIGDFAPPAGPFAARALQSAYWWAASAPFSLVTGDARHPLQDYAEWTRESGLSPAAVRTWTVLGRGTPRFRHVTAVRRSGVPGPGPRWR